MKEDVREGKVLPFTFYLNTLENGLTVVMVPYDSPGIVSYYTAMRVGSRDEIEPGRSGFAHLFEHMMFRGTRNLPGSVYDNAVTAMGADSSAWTWNDQTVYFFIAPSDKLPQVIEMEAERFKNLYYSREDFKTECGAVLGEYNKNFSNPVNKMEEVLWDRAFQKHTYKHTTMGFLEDIKAMPTMYGYSLDFFKRHYVPAKAIIVLAGDFHRGSALDLIRRYYRDWKGDPYLSQPLEEPTQEGEIRDHIEWDKPVLPKMLAGYRIPAFSDTGMVTASLLLASELLFGSTSDLYNRLVLKEQKVEDLGFWEWHLKDPGLLILRFDMKDKGFDYVLSALDEEIEKFLHGKVAEKRLERVRSHYLYSTLLSFKKSKDLAESLSFFSSLTANPMTLDNYLQRIKEVTPANIEEVIRLYLKDEGRTVVTLSFKEGGEEKGKEEVKK